MQCKEPWTPLAPRQITLRCTRSRRHIEGRVAALGGIGLRDALKPLPFLEALLADETRLAAANLTALRQQLLGPPPRSLLPATSQGDQDRKEL